MRKVLVVFIFIVLLGLVFGDVPRLVPYQGRLTDASGHPITGTHSITFKIYDSETGGTELWSETHSGVSLNSEGLFNVMLGSVNPLDLSFNEQYWLAISVDGGSEICRYQLGASPYTINIVDLVQTTTNGVTFTGNIPVFRAALVGSVYTSSVDAYGVKGFCANTDYYGIGVIGVGGFEGVEGKVTPSGNHIYYGLKGEVDGGSGTNYGVYGEAEGSGTNYGLYGYAHGSGINYSVYGRQLSSGSLNYAGYFTGYASGYSSVHIRINNDGSGISRLEFMNGHDYQYNIGVGGTGSGAFNNAFFIYDQSGSGEKTRFIIDSLGNIGISRPHPISVLDIGRDTVSISWGFTFQIHNPSFGDEDSIRTFIHNGWSGSYGDYLYIGSVGNRSNEDQGAIFISERKIRFGKGKDEADGLSTEYASVNLDNGWFTCQVLEIKGGSDLAEPFELSRPIDVKPGMVMSVDPKNPGKLVVSDRAYDTRVVGVVSGAGGVNPGIILKDEGTVADGTVPVAVAGRVYVWADASEKPIEPGDLLTTSDIPGYVMKVTDYDRARGAIIGKALTSLKSGKGLVLAVINLQ